MINAIRKFVLFGAIAGTMVTAAYATTIAVDLGSPTRVRGEKVFTFSGLNDLPLNGQTVSLNFVFSGDSFVRLFKSTSTSFLLLPMLDLFGAGTINNPTGTGYIFDSAHNPINSVGSFGGSVTTNPGGETFRFGLAGLFPLLADANGTSREGINFPLDIYGAHLDITLPNAPAFHVTGGEFGLFPNATRPWHDQFQIGDVPDNGATLPLALGAFTLLLGYLKLSKVSTLRNSINRSPLRRRFVFGAVALTLTWLVLSMTAQGADGGLPNNNTAEGTGALSALTIGSDNTAMGFNALLSNTTGCCNTAIGFNALLSNTTGNFNTANGDSALGSNTTGSSNTASGNAALAVNTTGTANTANGDAALFFNSTGIANTATGANALQSNTSGFDNTANGVEALFSNTTGSNNTASGFSSLQQNTTGSNNTANGNQALSSNTTGKSNIASGFNALQQNTTGSFNTASGFNSLQRNTTGSNNIAVGNQAGINLTTGDNNIDIGNFGIAGESATLRIGTVKQTAAYIKGIYGQTVGSGVGVIIDSSGHLGTDQSSARYKQDIKPMEQASESVLKLKPVTFRYKEEFDRDKIPQFGLIAEDVEKVAPDLVARDEDGKITTVRYEAVNAMLLNEFLKEHRKVEEQGATIAQQQKQIEALTATVRKVSEQIEVNKPVPQLVANDQ